jgi:hypothetical protein
MTGSLLSLLAAGPMRTTFQFGRIHAAEDWILPVVVTTAIIAYVVWMYLRDAVELRGWVSTILATLRVLSFLGLLVIWLEPQWRNEEDVVTPSRVVVMVDTSISMGEPAGADGSTAGTAPAAAIDSGPSTAAPGSRAAEAVRLMEGVLDRLRKTHEVHVVTWDSTASRPAASLERIPATSEKPDAAPQADAAVPAAAKPKWGELLAPRGVETRLGEALAQALADHRAAPVSGIVLVSDGGWNTGINPQDALAVAREQRVPVPPVLAVGVGSVQELKNVRVQDLAAPSRTYPNDQFSVKAYVQAQGMAGRTVAVELTWRDAAAAADPTSIAVLERQTKQVSLAADGKPIAVEFVLKPTAVGRTSVNVAIKNAPADDHNRVDNELDAEVEVTERRNRVLLFASGASREYQFLRNQLQRILRSDGSKDKEFEVDVLLQTGSDGISQDSSEILADFPDTPALMFEYDCVIAFDPDWKQLSTVQLNLLREWVADKAGGLMVIAGRIHTDATARDPELSIVRNLYPVEFGRVFALSGASIKRDKPWAVHFSDEGKRSEFLRLDDAEAAGLDPWVEFDGFYDYFPVKGVKDKAVVLAGLVDPEGRLGAGDPKDDARPYLLVEHAVGAGRVLYLGSGEFWRLRAVNPPYFTRLYTQLVRHVAQARLLRDSKRGVLMVDHDNGRYMLNDVVEVRAQLTDAKAEPLKAREVLLRVSTPDKSTESVKLVADPTLPGNFRGLFPVRQIGTFRLDVTIPDGDQKAEKLPTRRIQVRVPVKESDDVRLNEALLRSLAESTGGTYYGGVDAVLAASSPTFYAKLPDRTLTTPRLAKPVSLWDNQWMLAAVCSVLCLEWLIRRVSKLA